MLRSAERDTFCSKNDNKGQVTMVKPRMTSRSCLTFALLAVFWAVAVGNIIGCDELRCASEVSKCQLIGSCGCSYSAENCTCCLNCTRCLGDFWEDCCSCTGLCRKQGQEPIQPWHISTLLDLIPLPSLFNALTSLEASQDPKLRWSAYSLTPKDQGVQFVSTDEESHMPMSTNATAYEECVVAYMHDCTSLEKCKTTCESMGSAKQRWFHNGCCECVGDTCLSYGRKEALCQECHAGDERARKYNPRLVSGKKHEEVKIETHNGV